MFNTNSANSPNAFSAVKALQIAATEGQRIYNITQANISSVMPNLNLDAATETEIQQAVNIGKEVIAHTDPVSVPGYTGAGYIILDPITGEGAYKISGGGNGGFKAVGIVINVLETFYDGLISVAGYAGSKIPILNSIKNMLTVAKFVHSILDGGLNCSTASAVSLLIALLALVSLVITQTISSVVNPLVAFGSGLVLDVTSDWILGKAEECQ